MVQVLKSKEDTSVNFVFPNRQESRFVQRDPSYFIVYLSSHNGCDRACRFCHLTQTGQTNMTPSTVSDVLEQAKVVRDHYYNEIFLDPSKEKAKFVHFNWMARGEAFLNAELMTNWRSLVSGLESLFSGMGLELKHNISSIIPKDNFYMPQLLTPGEITLYYSLYSVDPGFRKRWLPKAAEVEKAFTFLRYWQNELKQNIVFHWAFIEGENDSEKAMSDIAGIVKAFGIKARMNVVRYNPFSQGQGTEPTEEVIHARFEQLKEVMLVPGSRIVPRVGFDVKSSCGMFVSREVIPIKEV